MDGGDWWVAVHGVAKSRTQLTDFTFTFHFDALEKEMATHSSVLAWRIPGTGEPGGLPSLGSHRIGHDWRDLVVVANNERHPCAGDRLRAQRAVCTSHWSQPLTWPLLPAPPQGFFRPPKGSGQRVWGEPWTRGHPGVFGRVEDPGKPSCWEPDWMDGRMTEID